LDPTYLHDQNPDLSDLYVKITTGEEEDPGPLIRDKFGARWVFSDNTSDHDGFHDNATRSGWFDVVHEGDDCRIYHIRDQKGAPLDEKKSDDKDQPSDDDSPP
jgi:hypothetical protein